MHDNLPSEKADFVGRGQSRAIFRARHASIGRLAFALSAGAAALSAAMIASPAAAGEACLMTDGVSIAIGPNAFVCGPSSIAGGANATAVGAATAAGDNATAMGHAVIAGGANASAFGQNATANGDNASAFGQNATANGANASAFGHNASANGDTAMAIGQGSVATGSDTTAIGTGARAEQDNSVAIGAGVATDRAGQVKIGSADNTYTMSGINSDDSKAAQAATTYMVTSDNDGNLATSTVTVAALEALPAQVQQHTNDIASLDGRIGSLESQFGEGFSRLDGRIDKAFEGAAMAMAMAAPAMPTDKNYAVSINWGNFESQNAFAGTALARVSESFVVHGGIGVGSSGTVGGRAGLTFAW